MLNKYRAGKIVFDKLGAYNLRKQTTVRGPNKGIFESKFRKFTNKGFHKNPVFHK